MFCPITTNLDHPNVHHTALWRVSTTKFRSCAPRSRWQVGAKEADERSGWSGRSTRLDSIAAMWPAKRGVSRGTDVPSLKITKTEAVSMGVSFIRA